MNLIWEERIEKIKDIFSSYSIEDNYTALLCSDLYIYNIASPAKHIFLYNILTSLNPHEFAKEDKIINYNDFKRYILLIYSFLPKFPMFENYIAEADWGEIRFPHRNQQFKIFYGNELENVYDRLEQFKIMFLPWSKEYFDKTGRDPSNELLLCLKLQDYFISSIQQKVDEKKLNQLSLGNIEIPQESFWNSTKLFINNFKIERIVEENELINIYSIEQGKSISCDIDEHSFQKELATGFLLPVYFINHCNKYYPILPRRYIGVLFYNWENLFKSNKNKSNKKLSYSLPCSLKLHKYIEERLKISLINPLVSAIHPGGKPHELIFSTSFVIKDTLFLIHFLEPFYDISKTSKEIKRLTPKIKEAIKLLENIPTTLLLHLKRLKMQIKPTKKGEKLNIFPIIIYPSIFMSVIGALEIPKDMPGDLFKLDEFLGIIDELDNSEQLLDFFNYLDKEKNIAPFFSLLDVFASYKDSHGVLVEGASEYTQILLDPHWGSSLRYRNLRDFWALYPSVNLYGSPRSWQLSKETSSSLRLDARNQSNFAIFTKIGCTNLFFVSPLSIMNFDQIELSNFLLECLVDTIFQVGKLICSLSFFNQYKKCLIFILPNSFVKNNDKFKHLNYLVNSRKIWCSEIASPEKNTPGIRIVFNDGLLQKKFESNDNSAEIDLLFEFLSNINLICPDKSYNSVKESIIKKLQNQKPRFKMSLILPEADFPKYSRAVYPDIKDYKLARKLVALNAKEINIRPGKYENSEAKRIINKIRKKMVQNINSEVKKYDFKSSVPFLIEKAESIINLFEQDKRQVKKSSELKIDYDPREKYIKIHDKYINYLKNYNYLIEKFIQINSQQIGKKISIENLKYILALVKEISILYTVSDALHYDIFNVCLNVSHDYLFEIEYEPEIDKKYKNYGERFYEHKTSLSDKNTAALLDIKDKNQFLDKLDSAFLKELRFSIINMLTICRILSRWASCTKAKMSTYYTSNFDKLFKVCNKNMSTFIEKEELKRILKFLTLEQSNILLIEDDPIPCDDLPVWEIKKRPNRYNVKPIIFIDGQYYWGPWSIYRALLIWEGSITDGRLPFLIDKKEIKKAINFGKKMIEDGLVTKAYEIINRFTPFIDKEVELHKRDKKGNHPEELGDYDVLAFLKQKNLILNIECKHLNQVFCLKDAKSLREDIFGKGEDRGYIEKIIKRENHLKNESKKIMKIMNWPIDKNLPKIISLFVSKNLYWWAINPPYTTNIKFVTIDSLGKYISNLK